MIFRLDNNAGYSLECSSLGARMVRLLCPDRDGNIDDIIQGFETEVEYKTKGKSQGALCGRYANRIANGEFTIKGEQYYLPKNNGNHCLHGGDNELRCAEWKGKIIEDRIEFTYDSPHLENGFPGNVKFTVTYQWKDNDLHCSLEAITDQETCINLTLHPYFNLNGEGAENIFSHQLQIPAKQWVEIDEEGIPTGKLVDVKTTPFDFRKRREIGNIEEISHPQMDLVQGYDHCMVIEKWKKGKVLPQAEIYSPKTGRGVIIESDYPGMQFYTANTLHTTGKSGHQYLHYSAICLEPQYYPDSPNQANFPFENTTPNHPYTHHIIYRFFTK